MLRYISGICFAMPIAFGNAGLDAQLATYIVYNLRDQSEYSNMQVLQHNVVLFVSCHTIQSEAKLKRRTHFFQSEWCGSSLSI